ncbi:putative oxidoreductase [Algoriphagus sp. 4150]|uniref:DoxX family protein n=1 Tax=Algoriphagus sp. 4150 TaxID=2817756 RepID=UPI00286709E3|nr:DoxX family protein [Algoriphagus sp. 4150]MDR7130275.1 putative oxidoreductase [Algoriphagus sp. 4150]
MLKKIIFHDHPVYSNLAHTLLRIFYGIALINHGQDKLRNFSEYSADFPDPMGVGSDLSLGLVVCSEFFGGLLILLGLFTRLASASVMVTFAIAYFIFHHADPFEAKELALFYFVISCYFLLSGSGKISLDSKFFDVRNEN